MKDLQLSGYKISTEVKTGKYPTELEKQLPELVMQCRDRKNKTIIARLEKLISKYPEIPELKNFLMTAFFVKGLEKKAEALNTQLLREHPDYLFARLNEANRLMSEEEAEKVPEVMGQEMELKSLYPDRNEFHISEVTAFLDTAIRYFILVENEEQAQIRLEILQELDPGSPRTVEIEGALTDLKMARVLENIVGLTKDRISPDREERPLPAQTQKPPKMHHPEINALYEHDFTIPEAKLLQILALPRQTLKADLLAVLQDGLKRYEYFVEEERPEKVDFVLHALFLLGEIKATETLPDIVDFLEYETDLLDFWLGDHLMETLWRVFYQLGEHNPASLQPILLNSQVNTYARTQVADSLQQLALHQPEKRDAVIAIFKAIFQVIIKAEKSDNLIDTEFVGLACWIAADAGFMELLPEMKQLYDKKYLSSGILGTFPEVEEITRQGPKEGVQKEVLPLPEFYREVVGTWDAYKKPGEPVKATNFLKPKLTQTLSPIIKAGRNDPCPCGSGKKFKKCCGS